MKIKYPKNKEVSVEDEDKSEDEEVSDNSGEEVVEEVVEEVTFSELVNVEDEDEEVQGADFRPEFKHGLVDVSGFPAFMTAHLKPLNKWSPNISSVANARLQWFKKATEYMKVFYAIGLGRAAIMKRLGIGDSTFDTLEARVMEKDGAKFLSMSVAQRYYMYVLQMEACMRMLNHYIDTHIDEADYSDKRANVVNAIKTLAGIHKDVLITGRDLGIINVEKGKGPRMLGEVNLAAMDTEALKDMFEQKFGQFKDLINNASVLQGPYARLLLEQKKKVFDMQVEQLPGDK